MKSDLFFNWCESKNLNSSASIAEKFKVSSQTIRNWQKSETVPVWVRYAMECVSHDCKVETFDFTHFKEWQRRQNVTTYEQTGVLFGIKRQAVHQWFRRGKFPNWLGLACTGYEMSKKN